MRRLLAFAGLVLVVSAVPAQPPAEVKIDPRYGIPGNHRLFPQPDPKTALASAVKAAEAGRYDYLVAHLMDEKFIESRIDDRARQAEPAADADLRALRDRQKADPAFDKRLQLPDEPPLFAERVRQEARVRGFRQVVRDVQDKLADDPTLLKDLRQFLREGDFAVSGDTATATVKELKDRQVFFRRYGDRWFIENRQHAEPRPDAARPGK